MDTSSALSNAGLPSIQDVYKANGVNFPTSVNDIGGSAKTAADSINAGPTNAFSNYMDYAKSLPTAGGTYQSLMQQNNIPQLQKSATGLTGSVNDLEDAINNVEPLVNANTGNSLVTNSQRQGMITQQKVPLELALNPQARALGQVQTGLSNAEANVASEVGAVNTGNSNLLGAAGMGVTVAQDNAARSMTGFTADNQNTMQMLLAKAESGVQMSNEEWSTLSTLATQSQAYKQQLGTIAAQQKYQTLNPAQTLVNTYNGKTYSAPTP